MLRLLRSTILTSILSSSILIGACALGQAAPQAASIAPDDNSSQNQAPQNQTGGPGLGPDELPRGKTSLVRGVLKRLDPVHDQLLIHAFGGGDVRVAFDPRTQMLAGNERTPFTSLPVGSVVSVDTVMDGGKLFAVSVRAGTTTASEMDGQVVRYDAAKSQLTLRDPMSPENFSVKITSSSVLLNQGKATSAQNLVAGTLVRAWFSGAQRTVTKLEILAEPGHSFTFQGKVIAVDLRSRVLSLSNDTDDSIRELAIDSLDSASLGLLKENASVRILAEFDGERYKVRSLSLVTPNP
jgi:hypothetical protein